VTRVLFSTLLAGSLAFGAACRKPPAANASAQKTDSPAAAKGPDAAAPGAPVLPPWADPKKPVPAQLPDVLARVNGESVTKVDFDRLIKNMEASAGRPIPADRRDELLRGALDQLVTLTVMAQETKALNVTVTDAEIDNSLSELRKDFQGNEQQFQAAIAARGMTTEQMRSDAATQLRISKMVQAETFSLPGLSEAEAREFYDKNPDKFKPEEVRASHILIRVPNNDQTIVAKAQAKAESVLKQTQGGADFADLAKKYSDDESKKNGGDLGFFPRGKLPPPFEQAAFSLKPGQLSEIVVTQFGFHIIKVIDRRVLPMTPFEQVSPQIREMLFTQRKEEKAKAFVESVKNKAKIEVLI
jgi:peptidyl-prolyl cis-trans isomerase C